MKSFLLHDGEDDETTEELHTLMTEKGLDWEGDNSGITVWIAVQAGDTMLFGDDGAFRVISKNVKNVPITKHCFRHVYDAMLMVEHDNGAHHANRIHPGMVDLSTFLMPYDYGVERLVEANRALEFLQEHSETEFADLIIGEQGDQEAVVRRHAEHWPTLQIAHDLLNDWFNGWERPYRWEPKP
jgi:hypothetical protein